MNLTNAFAMASLLLSAGLGIYFVSRKIFGGLAVTMMMLFTIAINTVCVRSELRAVIIGYVILLLIVSSMCFAYELSLPASEPKARRGQDDDEDEYVSTAPTMTVRQIVKEYTRSPQDAERRYTNSPMNVVGTISRITKGRNHSHVELDGMFMCVCPQGSVRSLRKGLRVSITGTLRGQLLLDDCIMVKHPVK